MRKIYLTLAAVTFSAATLFAQIRVSVAGGSLTPRDGSSWDKAYNKDELQLAINDASVATTKEVWVAAGIYKPTEKLIGTADRDKSFILKSDVKIYGGFAGNNGDNLSNRNFILNETILSGDLNDNNIADGADVYHVVASKNDVSGAVLDGFTIRHGYADGSADATVGSYKIQRNRGGAMVIVAASTSLEIKNLLFKDNVATAQAGAIHIFAGTNVVVSNSKFLANILVNTSNTSGGGIHSYGNLTIENSVFENNEAKNGGAIYNTGGNLTISKTKFHSNKATAGGGGMAYLYGNASKTSVVNINSCEFFDNTAAQNGGVIFQRSVANGPVNLVVTNSTFFRNKAGSTLSYKGGALGIQDDGNALNRKLYNNVFDQNEATSDDDVQIALDANSARDEVFQNNLFQSTKIGNAKLTVVNSYVPTLGQAIFANSTDPLAANFLHLVEGAATQRGDNNLATIAGVLPGTDLANNARLMHGTIDLGAYEYQGVLPVTISSFTANLVNGRTQLKWNVGVEENVNRYEVERSQNDTDFVKVAEVKASGLANYQAVDVNPALGTNYYRLTAIDNDGATNSFGEVKTVKVLALANATLQVYPNPLKGSKLQVVLPESLVGNYSYKLVSVAGTVIKEGNFNINGASLTLEVPSQLAAGTYVFTISNGKQQLQTKLIKL